MKSWRGGYGAFGVLVQSPHSPLNRNLLPNELDCFRYGKWVVEFRGLQGLFLGSCLIRSPAIVPLIY